MRRKTESDKCINYQIPFFLASNISHICFLPFCLDICAHLTHFQGNCCGEWVTGGWKVTIFCPLPHSWPWQKTTKNLTAQNSTVNCNVGRSRQVSLFGLSIIWNCKGRCAVVNFCRSVYLAQYNTKLTRSVMCALGIGREDVGQYIYNTLWSVFFVGTFQPK